MPGGKLRRLEVGGAGMDAGPTVFTLRRVFDALFADAGDDLDRRLTLAPARLLARHAWNAGEHLDLFADLARSTEAVGAFAGAREAKAFTRFAADAARIYATLDASFMRAARPSPLGLVRRVGLSGLPGLWNIKPFETLWRATGRYFHDARLRQLFARYATYCGSSPFDAPATLMLVAHAERSGVWYVEGGLHRLIEELTALALRQGAEIRCASEVREVHVERGRVSAIGIEGARLPVDAVVCNADTNARATGLFGRGATRAVRATPRAERSLSAVTWNLLARADGFPLAHHNVFFSADYRAEFGQIFSEQRLPVAPTVYVCAQDRRDARPASPGRAAERLFCLVNAPAVGDTHPFNAAEIDSCERRTFEWLASCGLQIHGREAPARITTPRDFHGLFPATGGALYGPASHGWRASFIRAGSRSRVPGLYLAGGSAHPGPGVPMAAISGRLAAASILNDCVSTSRSRPGAIGGGTSTP